MLDVSRPYARPLDDSENALRDHQTWVGAVSILRHRAANSCDCLACQTGRPDYPCLIEDTQP